MLTDAMKASLKATIRMLSVQDDRVMCLLVSCMKYPDVLNYVFDQLNPFGWTDGKDE
jgi:hypothetical protein